MKDPPPALLPIKFRRVLDHYVRADEEEDENKVGYHLKHEPSEENLCPNISQVGRSFQSTSTRLDKNAGIYQFEVR